MSYFRTQAIACPRCGKENTKQIWESMNAEKNPEAKEQLIDGTLFNYDCECGFAAAIDFNFLYRDPANKAVLYYVKEQDRAEARETLMDMIKQDEDENSFRIVTSQNVLREKALIFSMGLDDRMIELIKTMYLVQAQNQYAGARNALFYVDGDKWMLQINGPRPLIAQISREQYDSMKEDFANALEVHGDVDFDIDYAWAHEFLKRCGIIPG